MASLKLKVAFPLRINIGILFYLWIISCSSFKDKTPTLPFYNTADFTAEWIAENDTKHKDIHTIDTFTMYNQLGHVFTSDSLKGKIYVANFFFSICPSICPKMANNFKLLQDRFEISAGLNLVSFSVMPWVDTVGKLKVYGENLGINPTKWHLLTGNKERIYKLGRQSFFAEKKEGLTKDS
ncbi:SCO family protein, partial [Ferruginibacter sp.]